MNSIIRQTLAGMRQQPLLTGLSIAGTALAICVTMVVMMTREVDIVDYGCEPNRSKTLYALNSLRKQGPTMFFASGFNADVVNSIFLRMKTVDDVALYSGSVMDVEATDYRRQSVSALCRIANEDYFKVFRLNFREGQPFTPEECNSAAPVAIVTASCARKLLGRTDSVAGATVSLRGDEYMIKGLVDDVSPLFKQVYSDLWVAGNTRVGETDLPFAEYMAEQWTVAMTVGTGADKAAAKAEAARLLDAYNKTIAPDTLDFIGQPYDQEELSCVEFSNETPDVTGQRRRYAVILAILLIVPAINIASMTQSRLRQREAEIGVRRAFGAKRSTILWQVAAESLLQTLAAGLLGFAMCLAFCFTATRFLFAGVLDIFGESLTLDLDYRILFSPEIYGWTLLFCLLLNLMSSVVPAWRACRVNIVDALKQ